MHKGHLRVAKRHKWICGLGLSMWSDCLACFFPSWLKIVICNIILARVRKDNISIVIHYVFNSLPHGFLTIKNGCPTWQLPPAATTLKNPRDLIINCRSLSIRCPILSDNGIYVSEIDSQACPLHEVTPQSVIVMVIWLACPSEKKIQDLSRIGTARRVEDIKKLVHLGDHIARFGWWRWQLLNNQMQIKWHLQNGSQGLFPSVEFLRPNGQLQHEEPLKLRLPPTTGQHENGQNSLYRI